MWIYITFAVLALVVLLAVLRPKKPAVVLQQTIYDMRPAMNWLPWEMGWIENPGSTHVVRPQPHFYPTDRPRNFSRPRPPHVESGPHTRHNHGPSPQHAGPAAGGGRRAHLEN